MLAVIAAIVFSSQGIETRQCEVFMKPVEKKGAISPFLHQAGWIRRRP
jgi:hypothetical protein